ncbi:DUF1062 domain-containing protein [Vineibacter terrae]|uniref:DUF1062 domain-containing protein n=2 Tax=Vineibacter terrae TaxID=2586908 RepID=A0A5C8PN46_9HYPH|nr:DUF1062 domain-containing protein [Vineibacter terrae]
MSEILRVKWTIAPQTPPQPLLHCNRCRGTRSFRTSDKIRINANGKRIDAWLIYKCTSCDNTWNRPIPERRHVQSIDPLFLSALRVNDLTLARRLAFDAEDLRRCAWQLEEFNDVVVLKEVLSERSAPTCQLEILCAVPHPITLRGDRLLAVELRLPRSRIQSLERSGELTIFPRGSHALRRSVRDGMRLTLNVPAHDASLIVEAAKSNARAR